MKVITFNMNGIRSAQKKGFFTWMENLMPDVVCVQETKAQLAILDHRSFTPPGYHCFFADAQKPGYSGVAIYTREEPLSVSTQFGNPLMDDEGRFVKVHFKHVNIASLYLPSGTTGEIRQAVKYRVLDCVGQWLDEIRHDATPWIICADWNIAHKPIDLKNWKSNQKNSGFLPEERAWIDKVLDWGYIDAFREVCQEPDQYTWWSTRGQAYAKNIGWRLDYQLVTPALKDKIESALIYKAERFSDHAPLVMGYEV